MQRRNKFTHVTIYGLKCPLRNKIRYVGRTTNTKVRLGAHINEAGFIYSRKRNWITRLKVFGLIPTMVELEVVDFKSGNAKEQEWINRLKEEGNPILNGERKVYRRFYYKAKNTYGWSTSKGGAIRWFLFWGGNPKDIDTKIKRHTYKNAA